MPAAVIYIAASMLFVGAAPLPYGYYVLLRLVETIVFAWAAQISHSRKNKFLPWAFGLLALLFNRIIKVHLPKVVWAFIDIGAALFLLLTKRHVQHSENGRI